MMLFLSFHPRIYARWMILGARWSRGEARIQDSKLKNEPLLDPLSESSERGPIKRLGCGGRGSWYTEKRGWHWMNNGNQLTRDGNQLPCLGYLYAHACPMRVALFLFLVSLLVFLEASVFAEPDLSYTPVHAVTKKHGSSHAHASSKKLQPPPVVLAQPIEPPAASFPDLAWIDLSQAVLAHWWIEPHPQDAHWLQVRSKEGDPRYHVLVIVSKESSSYSLALSTVLDVFRQQGIPTEFTVANINDQASLVNTVLAYAEAHAFDLILSMGSESAGYLSASYQHGKIPVVTCINKDPVLLGQVQDYSGGHDRNIAYTSLNVPLPIYLSYLKTLRPHLRAVGLMYDREHKQVMATEVVPTLKVLETDGIQVVRVAVDGPEKAADQLTQRIPEAVAELRAIDPTLENVLFWMTSSTAVFSNMKTVNTYSDIIPVVASIPNACVGGSDSAVLGIGIDRRSNAHQAALYAIQILTKNTPPGQFAVGIVTPPDIAINFSVAHRIGLRIPFRFFENASFIYDYSGRVVRDFGVKVSY